MRTILSILVLSSMISMRAQTAVEVPPSGAERLSERARVLSERLAKVRGLSVLRPVSVGVYTEAQLLIDLEKRLAEEMPDSLVGPLSAAWRRFGLLPEGYDLRAEVQGLLREQIGGFYDPDRKELRLIEKDWSKMTKGVLGSQVDAKSLEDVLLIHELTHALQDQHFDLASFPLDAKDDDDLVWAVSSVVEGDATLTMTMGANGGQDPRSIFQSKMAATLLKGALSLGGLSGFSGMPAFDRAPSILKRTLVFPYIEGARLCLDLGTANGGFPGIDARLRRPPVSTEQVLHPEKLTGTTVDAPVVITLPATLPSLGAPVITNTLGELGLSVVLESLGAKAAKAAAAGWDGDRYGLYRPEDGVEALVWFVTFDDPDEAIEAARALSSVVTKLAAVPAVEVDWASVLCELPGGLADGVVRRGVDVVMFRNVRRDRAVDVVRDSLEGIRREERLEMPRRRKAPKEEGR